MTVKGNKISAKKLIVIIISLLLLATIITVSILLLSGKKVVLITSKNPTTPYTHSKVEGGIHEYDVSITTDLMVSNGNTEYLIVLPEETNYYNETASQEFYEFMLKATGAEFNAIYDNELTSLEQTDSNKKYISIGKTKILEKSGIKIDEDSLGDGGFIIQTSGNRLILTGGDDFSPGTLYATYELMSQLINFEVYSEDIITYDEKSDVYFINAQIKDIPDFNWRVTGNSNTRNDITTANRMRISQNSISGPSRFQMTLGGATYHNLQHLMSYEKYGDEHPEWFVDPENFVGGANRGEVQHSFTAQGNEEELEKFVIETVEQLKIETEAQPYAKFVILGQADYNYWDESDASMELFDKYGTHSASIILWVNKVSTLYYKWLNETYPQRDIEMSIFAYHKTTQPPAVQNPDGTWSAIDGIHLENGVSVLYAPIDANRIDSIKFNDPNKVDNNKHYYDLIKGWEAISDSVNLWLYGTNYRNDAWVTPYNAFNSMQENYKFAKEVNAQWMMYQRRNSTDTTTMLNFFNLASYLDSKLLWDVNLDMNELIDNYFNAYFGEAGGKMKELFDKIRIQFTYIEDDSFNKMEDTNYSDSSYWPQRLLESYISILNEAESKLDINTKDYNLYKKHINIESIGIRYMLIQYYGSNFSNVELLRLKQEFKKDASILSVTKLGEFIAITELFKEWNI